MTDQTRFVSKQLLESVSYALHEQLQHLKPLVTVHVILKIFAFDNLLTSSKVGFGYKFLNSDADRDRFSDAFYGK